MTFTASTTALSSLLQFYARRWTVYNRHISFTNFIYASRPTLLLLRIPSFKFAIDQSVIRQVPHWLRRTYGKSQKSTHRSVVISDTKIRPLVTTLNDNHNDVHGMRIFLDTVSHYSHASSKRRSCKRERECAYRRHISTRLRSCSGPTRIYARTTSYFDADKAQ